VVGAPASHAGSVPTHALMSGSLAIDTGSNTYASDPLTSQALMWDQRGDPFVRVFDGDGAGGPVVDIGAYEVRMPKVIDVVLRGSSWNPSVLYSFASLVPQGKQLAPIYTAGVDTIEIKFNEDVTLPSDGSALKLYGTGPQGTGGLTTIPIVGYYYYSGTHIAQWTFDPLAGDRYRIDLSQSLVVDDAGTALDGFWDNKVGTQGTLYYWQDDLHRSFVSGNGGSGTPFQFWFALQPGDYTQDGIVDQADYIAWHYVDGDGDGLVGHAGDYNVWNVNYSAYLQFQRWQGDYNGDGSVDSADWAVWRYYYGAAFGVGLEADGSLDGVVNTNDYIPWAIWRNTKGAWYTPVSGMGSAMALIDSSSAPRVVNVTISGSNSTHDPYSFSSHVGSGEQLRTVPVGGADTISITFDQDVNIEANYLRVVGLQFGQNINHDAATPFAPTLLEFTYDPVTMTAMWRFDALPANDQYVISLSDAVTNTQGYRLDGEWVNPATLYTTNSLVSVFPSGDGHAGGHFNFVFTLLAADGNRDNSVDEADRYFPWINDGQNGTFVDGDYNGDGVVGPEDAALWEFSAWYDEESVWMLADLNGDHVVNDTDFETLRVNYGLSGRTYAQGDLNLDGVVNMSDVDIMFAQYGSRMNSSSILSRVRKRLTILLWIIPSLMRSESSFNGATPTPAPLRICLPN
jgi:hypothetical protein